MTRDSPRCERVIAGIGCWVAALALYAVAVRTTPGRLADEAMFQRLREALAASSWIPDGQVLARSQLALLIIGVGVVCATCLVNRYTARATVVAVALGCTPGLVADAMKAAFSRPFSPVEFAAHNSFPSGTVAAFAGVAAALTFVARARLQQAIAWAAWSGTGLVALVVIRAHWHRLSDVLGAALIALGAWGIAAGAIPRRIRPEPPAAPAYTTSQAPEMDPASRH